MSRRIRVDVDLGRCDQAQFCPAFDGGDRRMYLRGAEAATGR